MTATSSDRQMGRLRARRLLSKYAEFRKQWKQDTGQLFGMAALNEFRRLHANEISVIRSAGVTLFKPAGGSLIYC